MTWTKEPPTKPGWYWVREIPGRSGIPGKGKSYLVSIVGTAPFLKLESAHEQAGFRVGINKAFPLYNMGEWAGPIEVPE